MVGGAPSVLAIAGVAVCISSGPNRETDEMLERFTRKSVIKRLFMRCGQG